MLFWGCFIALITTAFAFISRMFLLNTWAKEFGLDGAQVGSLAGIGIWPFAVSIIGFSLIIDRIGYKTAMIISFLGYAIWSVMGVSAYYVSAGGDKQTAYQLLYWGSLILGLSNGTVEAYINPVVATMFSHNKTKWLNILHAGWPGGLVLAGLTIIAIDTKGGIPWSVNLGIIGIPAIIFLFMLLPRKFPAQERVAAGVSYREMLAEFGIMGALVVGFLVVLQLMEFFKGVSAFQGSDGHLAIWAKGIFIAIGIAIVAGFAGYTKSLGRGFMFVMIIIMMPLATTEIGTDGWITGIMEGALHGYHPGWVLVFTSAIMMVLRFFAGPIIHSLSPLGLLALSAVLGIVGLASLSVAGSVVAIFAAAALYAVGKTFLWPTMLGVVSDQTPRGGALTLNALGGIGMLAVGVLGFPYIGTLKEAKKIDAVAATPAALSVPGLVNNGTLSDSVLGKDHAIQIIPYSVVDDKKLTAATATLSAENQAQIKAAADASAQKALLNMAVFPGFMLLCYLLLLAYFKSKGGYKAVQLTADETIAAGAKGPSEY
ncbi:MFS transporter [Humisphaera borealis]|uniref:MFS transporter n=2 Tax=Humisphaera borealis TaxID=2807512 RepID=A0A7M2X5Q0_9BACT|nr:MFS transporter [Humisphaera borealis]